VRTPVVGAAIIRDGRVLAARRTSPAAAAGRWEFPGGKVEPGETREAALVREVAEELGCRVEVTRWLTEEVPQAIVDDGTLPARPERRVRRLGLRRRD